MGKKRARRTGCIFAEHHTSYVGKTEDIMARVAALHNGRSVRIKTLTARKILESGLVGLWANRRNIKSSAKFARKLRVSGLRQRK